MKKNLLKISLLLIAAVMLVSIAFAGAASASEVTVTTEDELRSNLNSNNVVKLGNDIQLTGATVISIQMNKMPTLDLMGKTLTAAKDKAMFKVGVGATFTLEDSVGGGKLKGNGTIDPCNGGAVFVNGAATFIMKNGTISGFNITGTSSDAGNGGAVYIANLDGDGGTFIMENGTISDCCADIGGAVYIAYNINWMYPGVTNATFIMKGGSIIDCTASICNGVYSQGDFIVSGGATIGENDVGLLSGHPIIINSTEPPFSGNIANITLYKEDEEEDVGVWMDHVVVRNGTDLSSQFALSKSPMYANVHLEPGETDLILAAGAPPVPKPAYVEVSTWAELNKSVSEWTSTDTMRTVAITGDITDRVAEQDQNGINVTGLVTVTPKYDASPSESKIDGKGLGRLFNVVNDGNLTLVGNGSRVLNLTGGSGGNDASGGGIKVFNGGGLILKTGANITNCSNVDDEKFGGGVSVVATGSGSKTPFIIMDGGNITDCKVDGQMSLGGGVYINFGRFIMNSGNIIGCKADGVWCSGGGVNINYGTFIMNGGKIDGCSAFCGGGVYSSDTFEMNGGEITGCNADFGAGMFISGDNSTINGTATIASNNDVTLANSVSFPNITTDGTFSGSVGNITLFRQLEEDPWFEENATAWLGKTIVRNGKDYADKFHLSSTYTDFHLEAVGTDLTLAAGDPPASKPTYVEVSSWSALNKSVAEWNATGAEAGKTRIVAVTKDIADRVSGNNTDGILVKGNVIVTTTNSASPGEFKINGNGLGRLFNVNGGNLTLIGNGSRVLNLTNGDNDELLGGGLIINSGGSLILETGANITYCGGSQGGGVYVKNDGHNNRFILNGGNITDSGGGYGGGAVYVDGTTFVMTDGTISRCIAMTGSGVAVNDGATFVMSGGTITGCMFYEHLGPKGVGVTVINGTFIVNGTATIAENNDVALLSVYGYTNITTDSTFTGSVGNITLYDENIVENATAWLGKTIVRNGAAKATQFALSKSPLYDGFELAVNGTDLVLSKKVPPTYVEVSSWSALNTSVAEWNATGTEAGKTRIVAVNQSITDRATGENMDGINVYGNVILTTNATETPSEFKIDGLEQGRLFNVAGTGNLTLVGNGSRVLNLTNGSVSKDKPGGGIVVNGNLTLFDGANITYCKVPSVEGICGAVLVSKGTFTMVGGNIVGCTAGICAGVDIEDDGTFIMNGGNIIDCNSTGDSGGVYIGYKMNSKGTFIMNGGGITGCKAERNVGGVAVGGGSVFIMNDGNITGCSASLLGGGVHIADTSTFIMKGGCIDNCSANSGGGVLIKGPGTFIMNGGCIDNCSANSGGGVFAMFNPFDLKDVAKFTVNGTATITPGCDVALLGKPDEATFTNITIDGSFTGNVGNITLYRFIRYTPYGVTCEENTTAWLGQVVVKNGAAKATQFALSTSPLYDGFELAVNGTDLVLQEVTHNVSIASVSNGTLNAIPNASVTKNTQVNLTNVPDLGYHFVTYDIYNTTNASQKVTNSSNQFAMPGFNVTVNGSFAGNQTTVTYHNVSASDKTNMTYVYKETATVPKPTRKGYVFNGWNLSSASGPQFSSNATYFNDGKWAFTGANNTNLDVYGNWTANVTKITFMNETKSSFDNYTFDAVAQDAYKANKTGHTFIGWFDADKVQVFNATGGLNASATAYANGTRWNYEKPELTLWANFTVNTYNITYVQPGHGTVSGNANATYNTTVTVTATPDKGFQFSKLNVTEAGTTNEVSSSGNTFKMPAFDVNVTAVFVPAEEKIEVSTNTVSFGTVDLNTSPDWNTIARSLDVINYLGDTVTLTVDQQNIFDFNPSLSTIQKYENQTYTITVNSAARTVGDYAVNLTISNATVHQKVTISLSVVDTSSHNQNTTIVPTVPKIETHTDETGKVTEVIVAENNVTIDAENTAHIKDSSSDNSVTIHITNVTSKLEDKKQKLTLASDSIIATEYPVRKADLISENTIKVVYQPAIYSLDNFSVDNLPTLNGDFNTTVDTQLQSSQKYRGISMVSSVNKDIAKLDQKIDMVTITFNISDADVTGFSLDDLRAFKMYDNGTTVILDKPDIDSESSSGYHLVTATYPGGFSTDGICVPVSEPVPPTPYTPSHREQGQTQILQNGSQVIPVPTQTPAGNSTILPTIKPTQPTTSKSPAPFVGIIAGLGAALVLTRLRK